MQIGSKGARVVVFELSAGSDGSAGVARRGDAIWLGAARRASLSVRLNPSGNSTEWGLEGRPSARATAQRRAAGCGRGGAAQVAAWLTLANVKDRTESGKRRDGDVVLSVFGALAPL